MELSKTKSERIHAKKRAMERYCLSLNRFDLRKLANQISSGKAQLIEKQSHRVGVYIVQTQNGPAKVCYDRKRKTIITFLPKDE